MGAQSALQGLVSSVTGAAGAALGSIGKTDQAMADYSRQMRDAKLAVAKNNAELSKLRLQKMKSKMGGIK